MSLIIIVIPLLVILALSLSAVWLARRARPFPEVDPSRHGALLAGYRKALGWRWAGLGLGVAAAVLAAYADSLGRGLMLAPTVFGLCVIGGVVVGELATIPRSPGVRTAPLETRRAGDYLPRRLGGAVTAMAAALGALLVTTTLMGSADDMGRAGRTLALQCSAGRGSRSPWPGLFYGVPLGIAVAAGLLGAVLALRVVVLRPRSGSAADTVALDDVLRRRSAEAVTAATGVMVAGSVFAVSVIGGANLVAFTSESGPCAAPAWWTVLGVVLLAAAPLLLLLTGGCLALLLVSPRIRPAAPEDAVRAGEGARR